MNEVGCKLIIYDDKNIYNISLEDECDDEEYWED